MLEIKKGDAIDTCSGGMGAGGTVVRVELPGVFLTETEWRRILMIVEGEWGWQKEELMAYLYNEDMWEGRA